MSNLKRYYIDVGNACGDEYTCKIEMSAVSDGDWVKFEDIKHLLPTGAQQPQGAIPPDTAPHAADVRCNMANSEIIGAGQGTARRAPKKYKIVYADPPWSYSNFQGKGKEFGDVSAHYKTMSLSEMKELKIKEIADSDCMLFMWATYPNLPEAISLLQSWGFEYKTVAFTWVKTRGKDFYSGLGFYTNSNCEICLIGRKGRFVRNKKNVKQLIVSPIGRHSEKPSEIRDRIVALCGDIPRIELFARQRVDGWDAWGNEIEESPVLGEKSPAQNTMEICHTAPNSGSAK